MQILMKLVKITEYSKIYTFLQTIPNILLMKRKFVHTIPAYKIRIYDFNRIDRKQKRFSLRNLFFKVVTMTCTVQKYTVRIMYLYDLLISKIHTDCQIVKMSLTLFSSLRLDIILPLYYVPQNVSIVFLV